MQEYFFVACSLADILRRFKAGNDDWHVLPDEVAIQLNDTHPALAVTELMRALLDDAKLGWDEAWNLTVRTLAYTNHTLLPEALERWPVGLFELALPRHLEIVFEINRRFLDAVRAKFPGDEPKVARVSLIDEGATGSVRVANLAIVGTHSANGVAAIHSELLRTCTAKDLAEVFPERSPLTGAPPAGPEGTRTGSVPGVWRALPHRAHVRALAAQGATVRQVDTRASITSGCGVKKGSCAARAAWAKCWANAPMGSLFGRLKCEIASGEMFATHDPVRVEIVEYHLEVFYNRARLHSSLEFVPPDEFERARNQKRR